jgi:SAM-dependent methyltransferase
MSGWDDPQTAALYEAFCRRYRRYTRANRELVSHAAIDAGMRVLDLAAGTGRTAEGALGRLGGCGRVVCVEPSAPMRAEGARRLHDPRIEWRARVPRTSARFDRVLCGAAIWQLEPLADTLRVMGGLLSAGGALCFTIPALYLQEPDEPGGGRDPLLLALPQQLASTPLRSGARAAAEAARTLAPGGRRAGPARTAGPAVPLTAARITTWLCDAGFHCRTWEFRTRLTQAAYAAWLKIPVISEGMLAGMAPGMRARCIDAALAMVDRSSWKWERWRGWTAWKT